MALGWLEVSTAVMVEWCGNWSRKNMEELSVVGVVEANVRPCLVGISNLHVGVVQNCTTPGTIG